MVNIITLTGCRVSEALGITVDDIDFDQRTVTIVRLKRRIKLSCPTCKELLSRTARFCAGYGSMVRPGLYKEHQHNSHTC